MGSFIPPRGVRRRALRRGVTGGRCLADGLGAARADGPSAVQQGARTAAESLLSGVSRRRGLRRRQFAHRRSGAAGAEGAEGLTQAPFTLSFVQRHGAAPPPQGERGALPVVTVPVNEPAWQANPSDVLQTKWQNPFPVLMGQAAEDMDSISTMFIDMESADIVVRGPRARCSR